MSDVVADTHALIWYLEDSPRLGEAASQVFERCDRGEMTIFIPTISLVEIVYLQERGRISQNLAERFRTELKTETSGLAVIGLTQPIRPYRKLNR